MKTIAFTDCPDKDNRFNRFFDQTIWLRLPETLTFLLPRPGDDSPGLGLLYDEAS
jgi:hypothetical protein